MSTEKKENSLYDVVTLIGTSDKSWEDAVQKIVAQAAQTLRNLRIGEIEKLDVKIREQKIVKYRARVKLSFKYEGTR